MIQFFLHGNNIHNESRTAETALLCAFAHQILTESFRFILNTFQCRHMSFIRSGCRNGTGQYRFTVQPYGTKTAVGCIAAALDTLAASISEYFQKHGIRLAMHFSLFSIDKNMN